MLQVVLRTCDRVSLQNTRIVNKTECVLRCLDSIITNLENVNNKKLTIFDDNSSTIIQTALTEISNKYDFVSIVLLPPRDDAELSNKKKTRFSVEKAYEFIYSLPDDDLVYIVEDDYLHFPNAINEMVNTWEYLTEITKMDVGIFPQDFNQLYYHPDFLFNGVYVNQCLVVPTQTRYYRTTWFTHESFMIQSKIFKKFKNHFDSLLTIGDNDENWEGNTISNVWTNPEFNMFMPIGSLVIHMSSKTDIPFYISTEEVINLWETHKTYWSSEQESQVRL